MTRWLYSWVMWLVQPLLRRKLHRRGATEPGYLVAVPERFGVYASAPAVHDGPTVWVHAVSLGETHAAAVLLAQLRQQRPGMRLLLTHGTATGRAEGARLLQPGDLQAWQPWDTPAAVQRFLSHFKPSIGILMETEIWPNLVAGCARAQVPLVLANARLSEKSLRQARQLAWLARPAYAGLTAVWAQTDADAQRLASLGARVQGVLGNLKFDATPSSALLARARAWRTGLARPVVVFASSREGEEQAFLQVLKSNRALDHVKSGGDAPDSGASQVQWLIVPRHPQRFDEVAALIQAQGFAVSRRSHWADAPPADAPSAPTLWLGDSLGEMALYYGLADVALLGGSFEPLGGQNLIEAAACACPVVMGPHTFNFAQAAEQALAAGAAVRVASLQQAVDQALRLAAKPLERRTMVDAALAFAAGNRGAASKTAAAVVALLSQ
jgi:3-deoxy-D-manno-octulosonic-acid transferase